MKRVALAVLLALASCKRITGDTGPAPSASVAVLEMDLPRAVVSDEFVHVVLAVDVNADGTYAVNGERVPENEIMKRALREREKAPDVRAVIRADRTVPYQRVITAMDALRQAGISRLAFAVSIEPVEIKR